MQLVKKSPAFHETRRFITALPSARHLSLSWANPIQSIYPHPTSWRSILILSTHLCLGLPSGLLQEAVLLPRKLISQRNCLVKVHVERRVLAGTDLRQSALFTQQFLVLKVMHRRPSSEFRKILIDYCHSVRTTNLKPDPHM